ncbi:MAG: hypothetical protein O2856_05515, partial [Planctomycetota bacterium]|nr:hypothetical protein [Planctomycetota bacterium]
VSGSAFSTEVYFQIRRQFETDGPAEIVVERITDSRLISSREAFEEFVRQKPELQDGAGYEIWLISETSGQKVERPVVEFEITGGKPGPASEELPDTSELPRLQDLPFEQPAESETPSADDSPQASSIIPSGQFVGDADDSIETEAVDPEDDRESGDMSSVNVNGPHDAGLTVTSGTITSLAVSRFRAHQRKSETNDRKYSRAARFTRRNT